MPWRMRNTNSSGIYRYKRITYPLPDNQTQILSTKQRTIRIVDFTAPVDHRVKLKESEKKDKYLDLAK